MTRFAALRDLENVALIALAVAAGVFVPFLGRVAATLTVPITVYLVYVAVRDVEYRALDVDVGTVGLTLTVAFVALPALAVALAPLVLSGATLVGLFVVVASPTTAGSAIIWTRLSAGPVRLTVVVALCSLVLSPVVTPALLVVLLGEGVSLSYPSMLANLGLVVGGGVALDHLVPHDAVSDAHLERGAKAAIVVLVYGAISTTNLGAVSGRQLLTLATVSLVILAGGLVCAWLGYRAVGYPASTLSAVFFASSLKNLGIALLVASLVGVPGAVVAIVVFYVVQQFVGALLSDAVFPSVVPTQQST